MNYQLLFPELRDSKIRLTIGGPVLRIFVTLACLLGVVVGLGVAQEGEKQARRHFDPPSVVTAASGTYPLKIVGAGTGVFPWALEGTRKDAPTSVLRGRRARTEAAAWMFSAVGRAACR